MKVFLRSAYVNLPPALIEQASDSEVDVFADALGHALAFAGLAEDDRYMVRLMVIEVDEEAQQDDGEEV